MSLNQKYKTIHTLVAHLLAYPELQGKCCTLERLSTAINHVVEITSQSEVTKVNAALLKRIFKDSSIDKSNEFSISYRDLDVNNAQLNKTGHLFVRIGKTIGRGKEYNEVGMFTVRKMTTRQGGYVQEFRPISYPECGADDVDSTHPLYRDSTSIAGAAVPLLLKFLLWCRENIPSKVKEDALSLIIELDKEKKKQDEKNAEAAKQNAIKQQEKEKKQKEQAAKRLREKEQQQQQQQQEQQRLLLLQQQQQHNPPSSPPNNVRISSASSSIIRTVTTRKEPRPRSNTAASGTDRSGTTARASTAGSNQSANPNPKKKKRITCQQALDNLEKQKAEAQYHASGWVDIYRNTRKKIEDLKSRMAEEQRQSNTATAAVSEKTKSKIDTTQPIYFIANGGQTGMLRMNPRANGIILLETLEACLMPLPPEIDNEKSAKTRKKRIWEPTKYGASMLWTPNGTKTIATSRFNKLIESSHIITRLQNLVDAEKCTLSPEALKIITAGALHNYGGSDEALEMIIAMTIKALCHDIKFKITAEQLSKITPSRRTLATYEMLFATDCLMKTLYEIKIDGATLMAIICDHGWRAGQEHFVIVLVWSGWKNGNKDEPKSRTIKTFCPSIDAAGHSKKEAAEAIKLVSERFLGHGVEVTIHCGTGDSGGGAKIQDLVPELKRIEVMPEDGKLANCALHGMQKMAENPTVKTTGAPGNGKKCPGQLLYAVSKLCAALREIGGIKFLDDIFDKVKKAMLTNEYWIKKGEKAMRKAFDGFMTEVGKIETYDEDEVESLATFFFKAPRGIQEPTWSRWQSMIAVAAIVVDNWASLYFLAVAVKTHYKQNRYLCKVACTVLSLMNEKAEPAVNNTVDAAIEDCNPEEFDSITIENATIDTSPTYYIMLLFLRAFFDCVFNKNWRFLLQNNPHFGENTYGQGAQFMAERAVIMYNQANDLMTKKDTNRDSPTYGQQVGGWKDKDEFQVYLEEVKTVPVNGVEGGVDRAFFEQRLPEMFINEYINNMRTHILSTWWGDDLLHYMIGGDPTLAKEFCKMLVHYNEEYESDAAAVDSDTGEFVNQFTPADYTYAGTPESTTLGIHHSLFDTSADLLELNVKDTMSTITANTKWQKVLEDPFLTNKKHWECIEQMAAMPQVVRLFDLDENGDVDKQTWGDFDFTPLLDGIWRYIAIHSHHQQRCENFVQLAALISKTCVGEARRTWRAIACSAAIRRFNIWAIEILRELETDEEKKKNMNRVSGSARIRLYSLFLDELLKMIHEARKVFDDDDYKALQDTIRNTSNKASTVEKQELLDGLEAACNKPLRQYKAELATGYNPTALMHGKILLSALTKTSGKEPHVNDEFMARKIFSLPKFIDEYGELDDDDAESNLKTIPFLEKKKYIKTDEAIKEMIKIEHLSFEDSFKQTNAITPEGEMIKALLQTNLQNESNQQTQQQQHDDVVFAEQERLRQQQQAEA